MNIQGYVNSPEFNRRAGIVADGGIKLIFKWLNIGIKVAIDFIKSMIRMGLGR